jgi:hypothetical protein
LFLKKTLDLLSHPSFALFVPASRKSPRKMSGITSFVNRAKTAVKDFKLRRIDFDNGNRIERDTCEDIMMHQCTTVMVKRSELIAALKKTTWKEQAASFETTAPVTLEASSTVVEETDAEVTAKADDDVSSTTTTITAEPSSSVAAAAAAAPDAIESVASPVLSTTDSVVDGAAATSDAIVPATATAAAEAEVTPAVVAKVLVDAETTADFLKYDYVFNKLATLLQWDEKKRAKMEKKHAIKEMCFGDLCPSTNVSTNEMLILLAKNGCFGEMPTAEYLPERGTKPTFLVRLRAAPARISWAQLCQLYNDDFKFCELVVMLDKKFYELQKEAFKEATKRDKTVKKLDDDKLHIKQLQMTKVPVERLFKKILLKKFPQEPADQKHPFWDTEIGEKWATEGVQALTDPSKSFVISWRKVYTGLQEIAPVIKDAIVDNKLYDTEKSRLGAGRSSMSRLDSIDDGGDAEDANDDPTSAAAQSIVQTRHHHARHSSDMNLLSSPTAAASVSTVISPDELIQLQLQIKTSASQLADAQQQLATVQQLADERNAMIQSLQKQLSSHMASSANSAAVYSAEHLQQAVAQAHSQSQATIASLQQQVATAMAPSAASVAATADASAASQQAYTAEHLQQAVAQAHAQSQASIAHYQQQAQAALQQLSQLQSAPSTAATAAATAASSAMGNMKNATKAAADSTSSFLGNMQSAAKSALTMPPSSSPSSSSAASPSATPTMTTTAAASPLSPIFGGLFGGLKKEYR